ncbi:MAG: tetratricopeptide repeat protein, partial [Nitrospirae bacterium]|nr:tetratricopeptide repeat protein [Nitrospirota bacterium]
MDEERLDMFRQFEDGLSLYKQRRWDDALEAFKQSLNSSPGDGPSKKYIEEIERLEMTPPPEDWTGAYSGETDHLFRSCRPPEKSSLHWTELSYIYRSDRVNIFHQSQ